MKRKGILLAGGTGSRLHPVTLGASKHLLPVYDKPMVYYPLSVLMLTGIREILVVTTPEDQGNYQRLLGDGSQLGLSIHYAEQEKPGGIAEVFDFSEEFLDGAPVCLVLGDNIFYGQGFTPVLRATDGNPRGATLFGYPVKDPERFGVVSLGEAGEVLRLEEKPTEVFSNLAVTGLYFFDNEVVNIARGIRPSARGEKEIVDVLKAYQAQGNLRAEVLGRGFVWLDAGTPESLLEAGTLVQAIEQRQGLKIACLEEIAFHSGWITAMDLNNRIRQLGKTAYSAYLSSLLQMDK